jgi:carbon storage regulator
MLVLSRRIGEQIVIDENIVVTVISVRGNQVRLGFTAPPEVSICRQELLSREPQPLHVVATVGGDTPRTGIPVRRSR